MRDAAKIATIFGGTGFVGRHVVQLLARAGYVVKIATRVPERAFFLRPCGTPGQVVPFRCDYATPDSIEKAVEGASCVINCTGILFEKKKGDFNRIHAEIPRRIAQACRAQGVAHFIHISALGTDKAASRYAASKREGEKAVREAFPGTVILRPSVIFGPEDNFFNMFAELSRYTPVLPLIGGGRTKFQPVYVGDVAAAAMAVLARPEAQGRTYELGGPEIIDFRQIYERLFDCTGRKRCLISLPWGMAKIQATFTGMMPRPLLTRDQVETLKTDNVVAPGMPGLSDLGINATPMDMILPEYMEHYRQGGHFSDKKRA